MMNITSLISDAHLNEFQTKGFTILERVIPDDLLQLLRDVCGVAVADVDARADREGRAPPTNTFRVFACHG